MTRLDCRVEAPVLLESNKIESPGLTPMPTSSQVPKLAIKVHIAEAQVCSSCSLAELDGAAL
jgi:hypothetical protein